MALASVQHGRPDGRAGASRPRQSGGGRRETAGRDPAAPRRHRGANPVRRLAPLLLAQAGELRFRTAFCAAIAAWSVALVLSLGCLEVLRW